MNSSGGSANPTAIKIEPSYYALAFIIKVKWLFYFNYKCKSII
jgi:hypothetical protein